MRELNEHPARTIDPNSSFAAFQYDPPIGLTHCSIQSRSDAIPSTQSPQAHEPLLGKPNTATPVYKGPLVPEGAPAHLSDISPNLSGSVHISQPLIEYMHKLPVDFPDTSLTTHYGKSKPPSRRNGQTSPSNTTVSSVQSAANQINPLSTSSHDSMAPSHQWPGSGALSGAAGRIDAPNTSVEQSWQLTTTIEQNQMPSPPTCPSALVKCRPAPPILADPIAEFMLLGAGGVLEQYFHFTFPVKEQKLRDMVKFRLLIKRDGKPRMPPIQKPH